MIVECISFLFSAIEKKARILLFLHSTFFVSFSNCSRASRDRVVGTTGTASMPLTRIETLQTGAVTRKALDVAVLPDSELPREDGILGADVFVGRRLVFDIRRRMVRIGTD